MGGGHVDLSKENMMRGKGEEWGKLTPNSPDIYTSEWQTGTNQRTNNNKRDHLTDLSSNYHMKAENNRTASMRSNHMSRKIEATNEINGRSGTIVVNLYLAQGELEYIRTSSLALFCFSPSSISSVFRYT